MSDLLKKSQAIAVLSKGGTIDQAAEAAGVHRVTVIRWKKDPEFLKALEKESMQENDVTVSGLNMLAPQALVVLQKALSMETDVPHSALRAADLVLKRLHEMQPVGPTGPSSLMERLAELDTPDAADED
jgi:purine nucleoside permease